MTSQTPTQSAAALPVLPEGYTQRAATLADAEAAGRVYTVAYHSRGQDKTFTVDYFQQDWNQPEWSLEASSQVFFNPQGEMMGCITVWDVPDPTHPWMDWEADPHDPHWQDILRAMVAWGEQRSLEALVRCQPEERFGPQLSAVPQNTAFFESLGYQPIRYFYRMGITLTGAPVVEPLPAGFTLKTFDYPTELEALVIAEDDIWQDHYGYVPRPLPTLIEGWDNTIRNDPKFDATMWYMAMDDATGEIAGLVLCRLEDYTRPDQGYVNIVGVRRAYRKRGLAQAMLLHAFGEFWKRGQKTIGLGVDANSLTGATRLYERVGMSVIQQYIRMEKEMRPGIERMNTGHSS